MKNIDIELIMGATMNDLTIFICDSIGVCGTTDCHVKKLDNGQFEARIGFSLMGTTNMDEEGFENCNYDPWHAEFYDNYASGHGSTKELAIEAMKKDLHGMGDSLF